MKVGTVLPSFDDASEWLNRMTPNPREFNGRPTLVHFWSISSDIAEANLPHIAELRDQRKRDGLRVIAIDFWKKGAKYQRQMLWVVLALWLVTFAGFAIRHLSLALGGH